MYRYVDYVAALEVDADGFLIGIADGHTYQSAKLAYTVIDMHNKVARLHFLQLLHRKRHLARTRSVTLEVVLVESVEYLMVGEEAQAQVVIGKSLVQSMVDGCEIESVGYTQRFRIGRPAGMRVAQSLHLIAVEYITQTTCLFLRVGEYIQLVALQQIVFERLCKQLEILVKQRLGRNVERYGGLRSARRLCAELYRAETAYLLAENGGRNEVVLLTHVAYYLLLFHLCGNLKAFGKGLTGKSVVVYLLYRRAQIQPVFHHEHGVVGQHCGERLLLFGCTGQLGHDADALL